MSNQLRKLSRQEHFYQDTLKNLKNFVERYDAERDKGMLAGWMRRIEMLFDNFQSNRLEIELMCDEVVKGEDEKEENKNETEKKHRSVRQEFEQDYVYVYGFLTTELRKLNEDAQSSTQSVSCTTPNANTRVRLPEVKLPTFDGTISEWITFRDSFKSLIHSNEHLSPIDKFSYLTASLVKDAKTIIDSIELTAANYSVAWQLLETRFNNKKLVVKNYIDALFAIDSMKRESYESLMHLVDDFEKNLRMIDKMEIRTDDWSVLLAHMLCSRLDPSTLKQWETHH